MIEDNVPGNHSLGVFLIEFVQRKVNHIHIVIWLIHQLFHFNHIASGAKGHVMHGQSSLVIDHFQHVIDVGIIQHQEGLWIFHQVRVFLKYSHAETMEGGNITSIVISSQVVDTLAHLICRLIGESDTKDVLWQNSQFVYQISVSMGQSPGFTGACAGNYSYITFCAGDSFPLTFI